MLRGVQALEELARRALHADMDALHTEVDMLRRQVVTLQALAGLPLSPGRSERQQQAVALRRAGISIRSIAATLQADRSTIASDLRAAGAEPPQGVVVGADGRRTSPQIRPTA